MCNMVTIYCIEDINDLKYVGSTKQYLSTRLAGHRIDAGRTNRNNKCSSSKLNLYNCIIYELERCPENERHDKEKYWINKIDCVNKHKLNYSEREYSITHRDNINKNKRIYRMRLKLICNFLSMLNEF